MPSITEVAGHSTKKSCWVIISGTVYDVTGLIDHHPGGPDAILSLAGKDATEDFELFHSDGTLQSRPEQVTKIGSLDPSDETSRQLSPSASPPLSPSASLPSGGTDTEVDYNSSPSSPKPQKKLPLKVYKSLDEFEAISRKLLPERSWVYFNSGAETRSAFHTNRSDWARIGFRPRILRDVSKVSVKTSIMGTASTLPIFVAPTASAQLGHRDGELCLTRGATRMGIPQGVSTYASKSPRQIKECFQSDPERRGGALFFQLYVPKVKKDAEKLIGEAKALGYDALLLTIDNPVLGKRDDNDRVKELAALGNIDEDLPYPTPPLPGEEPGVPRASHDSTLKWGDLPWIRKQWGDKPLILKGIQTFEDAVEALNHDIDGIYISNHGGRQLDYAPSAVQVLLEIRQNSPHVFDRTEVYVDGGVMRGTDVVKALCLGARAVGVGRGLVYPLSSHGTDGVVRAIEILSEEIQNTIRLLGATDLSQLNSSYLNLNRLQRHEKALGRISKL